MCNSQTMVKTAGIMHKKPEESKYILTIIEICGEIVSVAGECSKILLLPVIN